MTDFMGQLQRALEPEKSFGTTQLLSSVFQSLFKTIRALAVNAIILLRSRISVGDQSRKIGSQLRARTTKIRPF
jgi:hypothetical protein